MELLVLTNLTWLCNPPTAIAFVIHLLLLLPADEIDPTERNELFESSRFLAELSVADSFFVDTPLPSIIGLAAILNSLDKCQTLSHEARTHYLRSVAEEIGISHEDSDISIAQNRLRLLVKNNE